MAFITRDIQAHQTHREFRAVIGVFVDVENHRTNRKIDKACDTYPEHKARTLGDDSVGKVFAMRALGLESVLRALMKSLRVTARSYNFNTGKRSETDSSKVACWLLVSVHGRPASLLWTKINVSSPLIVSVRYSFTAMGK